MLNTVWVYGTMGTKSACWTVITWLSIENLKCWSVEVLTILMRYFFPFWNLNSEYSPTDPFLFFPLMRELSAGTPGDWRSLNHKSNTGVWYQSWRITAPRSTSQSALVGPLMRRGPTSPSEYWSEKWLWYHVVPYVVARNRYVKEWPGGIGHWVIPGTPSMAPVPFWSNPCQWTEVLVSIFRVVRLTHCISSCLSHEPRSNLPNLPRLAAPGTDCCTPSSSAQHHQAPSWHCPQSGNTASWAHKRKMYLDSSPSIGGYIVIISVNIIFSPLLSIDTRACKGHEKQVCNTQPQPHHWVPEEDACSSFYNSKQSFPNQRIARAMLPTLDSNYKAPCPNLGEMNVDQARNDWPSLWRFRNGRDGRSHSLLWYPRRVIFIASRREEN